MDKKADLLSAIACQQPQGRVPFWELEFHLWDAFAGCRLILGREYQSLSAAEQEKGLYTNAEIFIGVAEELSFSALTMPSQYWEIGDDLPAYYWLPEDARIRQAKVLRQMASPELMLVANCSALIGIPMGDDYVPFAYRMFDSPEEVDELAKTRLQEGVTAAKKFADVGVEIGLSTTDLADNHSTFMNPRQLERYVWPYLQKWVEELKNIGMLTILHSDGNLTKCLEAIADSGVDCLQAIDPTAGMDMLETKNKVGDRLCLSGNVDCSVLLMGSPEEVYEASCRLLITCKDGGGLIFGASNAVQPEVQLENYRAMVQAWQDCGSYHPNTS